MERRWLLVLVVCGGIRCAVGNATVTVLNPGDTVNFANYVDGSGNSILVADKLFGDFDFIAGGNTNVFGPMTINLTAISNSFGYGIKISAPFHTQDTQLKDFIIDYSVQVTNAPFLISDLHLDYNGFVVNSGFSSVTESVFDQNGIGVNQLGQMQVFEPPLSMMSTSMFLNTPQVKLFLEKDIEMGGDNTGDQASISAINQVFSQIPEPSSIMLVSTGLAALGLWHRRRG
ncbi:MAG TPA: PEP-CTERM sorting domain-containing protein [Verrucomicrobiae bacterium]|nr:PEP-CTERM sorting domain-containing protein [Verrucomicrobiae bacterium]